MLGEVGWGLGCMHALKFLMGGMGAYVCVGGVSGEILCRILDICMECVLWERINIEVSKESFFW